MYNKNGFTLIELIVSLSLISIIALILITLFIQYTDWWEQISNETELQFQSQYTLNFIYEKIAESSGIELVMNNTVKKNNCTGEHRITKLSFKINESSDKCYVFEIRRNKIFYGIGSAYITPTVELGVYIERFMASPYPEENSFADASGIRVKLLLKKDKCEYKSEQLIIMRNNPHLI